MNYRHIYHAGNFADVFKHIVLIALLEALSRKEKPFCYIESQAGAGLYDLTSGQASKSKEFTTGIEKLFRLEEAKSSKMPWIIQKYLDLVKSINPNDKLIAYPGSPLIAATLLRPEDRMILVELRPDDAELLRHEFYSDKRVAVHQSDGYQALKAFLPPKENRGLVLIDPAYEENDEVEKIANALTIASKHWRNGLYAIWYPIKEPRLVRNLFKALTKLPQDEILIAELSIYPEDSRFALNGSGLAIINPPWNFDQQLKTILPWLWKKLSPEKTGGYRVINLKDLINI